MTDHNQELLAIVTKFADYCACDEYHYGDIDGMPGNHDPKDGHMEFDEDAAVQALNRWKDAAVVAELKQIAGSNEFHFGGTAGLTKHLTDRIQAIKARNGGDDE